ncbi:MAG: DUF975 family protein [Oscillospiraceae bacterium]|nr:DUF975 family protein [Oscillospiraceae bacterium]
MELFRIIKKDARRALGFCGGRSVAAAMIMALAYLAVSITEGILLYIVNGAEAFEEDFYALADTSPETLAVIGICAVMYALILPGVYLGNIKLHVAFAEGKDESLSTLFDMFSSFKKYIKAIFFSVFMAIRLAVTAVIFAAPGLGVLYCADTFIPKGTPTLEILKIGAICVGLSVAITGFGAFLVFAQRWFLAPYYFAEGNKIGKAFSLSVKATKEVRSDIIRFNLSFIGWALLSFLILPLLWSVPYYFTASAIYAKFLMEKYEHSLAQVPETFEHEEEEPTPGQEKD